MKWSCLGSIFPPKRFDGMLRRKFRCVQTFLLIVNLLLLFLTDSVLLLSSPTSSLSLSQRKSCGSLVLIPILYYYLITTICTINVLHR